MHRGASPIVKRGPYADETLHVDHIIQRSVTPALDLVLANLELMPASMNLRKGRKIGQRQVDLANKLQAAGILTVEDHAAVIEQQTPGYLGD